MRDIYFDLCLCRGREDITAREPSSEPTGQSHTDSRILLRLKKNFIFMLARCFESEGVV